MAAFSLGDCVRICLGPGGTYPSDPSLVGKEGTWQGTPAVIEFSESQPPSPVTFYRVTFPDRDEVMIESEFVEPCPPS